MSCARCHEYLLEAGSGDIAQALSGRGEPRHASHLRECPECRGFAERIFDSEAELARSLSGLRPIGRTERAAQAAVREAERRLAARRRRRTWLWAAAAVVVGFLVVPLGDLTWRSRVDKADSLAAVAQALPPDLEVEPLGDESVAVFETTDPDVVVLWFYQGRGE